MYPLLLLAFLFALPTLSVSISITPSTSTAILCLFPLSGHYALLQRLNFYLVLLFAACARPGSWLAGGAFAAAMSVAGVAAIHALALLSIAFWHNHHPSVPIILDLDAGGAWCILAPAALILTPMLAWTPALRGSPARPLLRLWGAFISLGAACAFATLTRTYPDLTCSDGPCSASSSTSMCNIQTPWIPLRSPMELTPVPHSIVFSKQFGIAWDVGIAVLCAITLITLPVCMFDAARFTRPGPAFVAPRYGAGSGLGSAFVEPQRKGWHVLWVRVRAVGATACAGLFVATVVVNEWWVMSQVPRGEGAYTIGQWGVWAATALVVIAGLILGGGSTGAEMGAPVVGKEKGMDELIRVV